MAAVFDGFFNAYQRRIRDLIRIATHGTGNLLDADPHPDLVKRIASEAAATAQSVLTMCIRAFDYLPPVDITLGDYLRALISITRLRRNVEAEPAVPWTMPESIAFDPTRPLRLHGLFRDGFRASTADGQYRFIPHDLAAATLRAAVTRNGGEPLPDGW